jgi:D-amino-acid dehydrogenase
MHVAVIGGGVVGLSAAHALAAEGVEVTVLEAGRCGGAALSSAGWVVPFLSAPRAAPGAPRRVAETMLRGRPGPRVHPRADPRFAQWLWRSWRACTPTVHDRGRAAVLALARDAVERFTALRAAGVDFEMHTDGLLAAALTDAAVDDLEAEAVRLEQLGYAVPRRRLDGAAARALEPALSERVSAALLLEAEAHVDPVSLVAALAEQLGPRVREHAPVASLRRRDGGWEVRAGGEALVADAVLIAAGVASRGLLDALGVRIALTGARGISLTGPATGTVPRHPLKLSEANVAFAPYDGGARLSGGYGIGATTPRVPRGSVRALLTQARPYLRDMQSAAPRAASGVRPVTPDDLPVIGPVPGLAGLHVATGHGTLGVTLAPGTAAAITDLIVHGRTDPLLEAFRADRPALAGA